MAIIDRSFSLTVMGLILVFALIHLGVSIGIIVPYRKYGDIFRPQIGLSSFNLVISLFGLITGILGIIAAGMRNEQFGRIVCIVSGVLGIFALASLVTAIIINSKSVNYVSSHFSSNLIAYQSSADARTRVDLIQNKYQCCGTDIWLDWVRAELNTTSSMMNVSSATISTSTSTSTMSNIAATVSTTKMAITSSATTSSYGGIEGLPLTFGVVLPESCCTWEATLISNTLGTYCISNYNGVVNHFNTAGCAKSLDITAGNQALGFAVINSFMVVLAFVAIPVLLGSPSDTL